MSADEPADRRRGRHRKPEHRFTDDELTALVGDIAAPVAQILTTLFASSLAPLRALLDESYQRGHRAGLAEAKGRVVLGTPTGQVDVVGDPRVTIRLSDPPPGPSPALLAEMTRGSRPRMAASQ
jgi:hypothetical protein